LKRTRDLTDPFIPLLGNLIKIGAAVSVPFGLLLLLMYLGSVGVPLPELGTPLWALLSIMTVIFTFITVVLSSFVLVPAYSMLLWPPDNTKTTRTRWLTYLRMHGPFCRS
jgi:hypothetical protein